MNRYLIVSWCAAIFAAAGCGQEVKIVEIDPPSITFVKSSQSEKISAKALDIHSAEMPGVSFSFSSEDSSVAVVDGDGTVKPRGNGSTVIVARTPTGVTGETFVKVCLPKEIKCDPADKLNLRVGVSAPIKCKVFDCNDAVIPGRATLKPADEKMLLKEGDDIFIGLAVGDTSVTVEAHGLKKTVAVRVDEQTFRPGSGPGSGKGGKGGGRSGNQDPYGSGNGRFDHILKNMQFGGN
jgi:hypothetical protein